MGMKSLKYLAVGLFLIASVIPLGVAGAPSDEGAAAPRDTGRIVLGELFTATWCGYCPAADNSSCTDCGKRDSSDSRFSVVTRGQNEPGK